MRIKFSFENGKGNIELPINYNYQVQGMVYKNISNKLADFLHKKGFNFEKRKFRMFVFSRLLGKYRVNRKDKKIKFFTPFSLLFSTPYSIIAEELAESFAKMGEIKLGKNKLMVSSIQVFMKKVFNKKINIKILSPVTIYSTLYKKNEGEKTKKTYYYTPFENEFNELIRKNILKKYIAFYEEEPKDKEFSIKPLKVSERRNLVVTYYKNTVIKGWTGIYTLTGNPELINFSYNTGLGSKNSQGFGMWEEWRE